MTQSFWFWCSSSLLMGVPRVPWVSLSVPWVSLSVSHESSRSVLECSCGFHECPRLSLRVPWGIYECSWVYLSVPEGSLSVPEGSMNVPEFPWGFHECPWVLICFGFFVLPFGPSTIFFRRSPYHIMNENCHPPISNKNILTPETFPSLLGVLRLCLAQRCVPPTSDPGSGGSEGEEWEAGDGFETIRCRFPACLGVSLTDNWRLFPRATFALVSLWDGYLGLFPRWFLTN